MHLPIFFFRLLLVVVPALLLPALSSCGSDHDDDRDEENRRTLFVYMPWSTDLLSCFETNLSDFEAAIEQQKGLKSQRVIVYLARSKTQASMFEIACDGGQCTRRQLKEYSGTGYTTLQGLTAILADVKTYAPATLSYSMIIGCHGLGWVPVKALAQSRAVRGRFALHWNRGNKATRLFGGRTSDCQTDIETLRESMEAADFHTEYILFDDCYMSGIEVAYELRHVTRRLIASTSEMMMYGIPYKLVGGNLLGTPDYSALCRNFLAFYSSYSTPSGTLTVTDCSKLDSLALAVARLNLRSDHAPVCPASLQRLGGAPRPTACSMPPLSTPCTRLPSLPRRSAPLPSGSFRASPFPNRAYIPLLHNITAKRPGSRTRTESSVAILFGHFRKKRMHRFDTPSCLYQRYLTFLNLLNSYGG